MKKIKPSRVFIIANAILLPLSLIPILCITYRLLADSGNHVGFNLNLLYLPYLLLLCWSIFCLSTFGIRGNLLSLCLLMISLTALTGLYALYHFNILLSYEDWIKKGMPPPLGV